MDIAELSRQNQVQAAASASTKDQKSIAENFDVFLKLLTTQLKNQNPLEPLKTNEFTQQMVAFTGVEQQVKANKNLENLGRLFQQATLSSSVSYIGKTVTAEGDATQLQDNNATWDVNIKGTPEESKIVITDNNGNVVFTKKTTFREGMNEFNWDGQKIDGSMAAEGLYTIKVHPTDKDGNLLDYTTLISGIVTGVDMTGSSSVLNLGDRSVKLDNVKKIEA
ncbi:MAG: flagellar hook assembly protein FlgD [Rhizobiales bacterium]|nr:flagellar hook assembly protein FlgD [Hyphomicrobiales bacterium]